MRKKNFAKDRLQFGYCCAGCYCVKVHIFLQLLISPGLWQIHSTVWVNDNNLDICGSYIKELKCLDVIKRRKTIQNLAKHTNAHRHRHREALAQMKASKGKRENAKKTRPRHSLMLRCKSKARIASNGKISHNSNLQCQSGNNKIE